MDVLHRGVLGRVWQFLSLEQPAVQVFDCKLQMPSTPRHCAFDTHSTQLLLASLQTVPKRHALVFVPPAGGGFALSLHWPQGPPKHAGLVESGHASTDGGLPGVPFSALQPAHWPVAVLQTGVDGESAQSRFVVHWTHLFVVRSQIGFAPEHWLDESHSRHSPVALLQAGRAVVGHAFGLLVPLSPSHFTHVPVLTEQTGAVSEGHSVGVLFAAHCTHASFLQNGFPATAVQSALGMSALLWSAQATQCPAALQIGAAGSVHCTLVVQPAAHFCPLQKGRPGTSEHWASTRHSTQTGETPPPAAVSQTHLCVVLGVVGHAVTSLALHC